MRAFIGRNLNLYFRLSYSCSIDYKNILKKSSSHPNHALSPKYPPLCLANYPQNPITNSLTHQLSYNPTVSRQRPSFQFHFCLQTVEKPVNRQVCRFDCAKTEGLCSLQFILSVIMINLYKQSELRSKNKSLFPINKSHTASMNLRVSTDLPLETMQRDHLKNSYRQLQDQSKSRSQHKYKKSLVLQENMVQLAKKNSEFYCPKNKDIGMSTERFSKEKIHKRSVDYGVTRTKIQGDQPKLKVQGGIVEVNADELKQIVNKLKQLRSQKQNLKKELAVFKRETKKSASDNPVFKALA